MTIYDGVSSVPSPLGDAGVVFPAKSALSKSGLDTWINTDGGFLRDRIAGGPAIPSTPWDGVYNGCAENLLFERIWLRPNTVNARFIVSASSQTINIWNAFQKTKKPFTSYSAYNPTGTTITTGPLPALLQPTADMNITIGVDKVGPSIQDTIYSLIINGVLYQIPVRGIRILILTDIFNYATEPELSYRYVTSVFTSERGKEQRRSLQDLPTRSIKGSYLIGNKAGQLMLNRIQYGHDKLFAIPILDEQMTPTAIATGGKLINLSTPTTTRWNFINNCSYIAIIEPSTNQAEVHEIDSYTASTITTVNNIVYTWNTGTTRIFPVFFGVVDTLSISEETDTLQKVNISYEEKNVSV